MKRLMSCVVRVVIGVDLAVFGVFALASSSAMAMPFPVPVFDCNVECPGYVAETTIGGPGAGLCPNNCRCTPSGGAAFVCTGA